MVGFSFVCHPAGSSASGVSHHDLLEVENLLESYFMMVDGTLAKLSGIGEYIDDTEDYINIELDYNRNR
jgi:magnesium transporter